MLFGITDQRNPTQLPGVLGAFEYRHSGWIGLGDEPGGGASLSRESMSVLVGDIDEQAQIDFAKGCNPWNEKGYIKVTKTQAGK